MMGRTKKLDLRADPDQKAIMPSLQSAIVRDSQQTETQPKQRPQSRLQVLALLIMLAVVATDFVWNVLENFHTVIAGVVYRSGQLSSGSLDSHIASEQIRTVINLRGAHPEDRWYQQEVAVAERDGIVLHDLALDSQFPKVEELKEMIGILDACPKPVLIHCNSGTDRTGIAAAICILLMDESGSPDKAVAQLHWRFGHLAGHPSTGRLSAFVTSYQTWLTAHGFAHSPMRFREWISPIIEKGDLNTYTTVAPMVH